MIQIKPKITHTIVCKKCNISVAINDIVWQGIHVCGKGTCKRCGSEIVEDLPVGHGRHYPFQVNLTGMSYSGDEKAHSWFGKPLFDSLTTPDNSPDIRLVVEQKKKSSKVIILNCIDFLYGHVLLKLLNAQRHLNEHPKHGLVVNIPRIFRWMVPEGVSELWTVEMPLSATRSYFIALEEKIKRECKRFKTIFLSESYTHPKQFSISFFTGIPQHDFNASRFRVTFIWREDRLWVRRGIWQNLLTLLPIRLLLLWFQNRRVKTLFERLKKIYPNILCTVAGIGTSTRFPSWIHDHRVIRPSEHQERELCRIYAESRTVIGVHGSNMLLPTGHAGFSIILMPNQRWGNIAQDTLFGENDNRLSVYRYRFAPIDISIYTLTHIIKDQINHYAAFRKQMSNGNSHI